MEEKTLTARARERRDPYRGRASPSWRRRQSLHWPGSRPPEVGGGDPSSRKQSETAPACLHPSKHTLNTSGLWRQREREYAYGVGTPHHLQWSQGRGVLHSEAEDTPGEDEESAFSISGEGKNSPLNFLVPRQWNRAEPLRSGLHRAERALRSRKIQFGGEGDSPKGEETAPGLESLLPSSPGHQAECGGCATFPK